MSCQKTIFDVKTPILILKFLFTVNFIPAITGEIQSSLEKAGRWTELFLPSGLMENLFWPNKKVLKAIKKQVQRKDG